MTRDREPRLDPDDRPPICPACGVTQGIVMEGDRTDFVCLECGFSDSRDPASSGDSSGDADGYPRHR